MTRTIRSIGTMPYPERIPTASSMQSMATRPPTEISMPPVIITTVRPEAMQMSPALVIRIFRKVWKWLNPLDPYAMQPPA